VGADTLGDLIDDNQVTPARWHQPPRVRSVSFGSIRASYVVDGSSKLAPATLFPDSGEDYWRERPEYLDSEGYLTLGAGGLLVEDGEHRVLIDTGMGPILTQPSPDGAFGTIVGGDLLRSLAALGVHHSQLDTIAFTHLHTDHTGWLATVTDPMSGESPLGHAQLVMTREEAEHGPQPFTGPSQEVIDALQPRLRLLADGELVKPGVVLRLSPGHTVGHAIYEICSGGTTLIAFGDTFHSPAHVEHPEWTDALDLEHVQAVGARHRLLERLSQPDTLGFGLHFADVAFGRVSMAGGHPTWCPVTTDG
jgi:glyoxylase-like metal-dependent hydrolase (beta-lactamase superfamily II)